MIGSVRGSVVARGSDHVVVEANGVGYKVFVPRHPSREEVVLHTHHVVRDDASDLYGFESREELALFEMLISVSGVGPKAGLAILSVARPAEIAAAIATGDAAALARAPGVGKKTAERLIVDLKGKVAKIGTDGAGVPVAADDDAQAALVALGYTASEAATALRNAPPKGGASTEERISAALRAGRTAMLAANAASEEGSHGIPPLR